jgi:hypothetical protein
MMSGFYDGVNGHRTYRIAAATLSSAAVVGRVQGPAGKVGRVTGWEYVVTTSTTTGAASMTVDTNAGLTAPFTTSIPVATAPAAGAATAAQLSAGDELPADTIIEIASDGGPAAGAADLLLTIQWY